MPPLAEQILESLTSTYPTTPTPNIEFLRSLVRARPSPPPLPSLVATARIRILAADLTLAVTNSYNTTAKTNSSNPDNVTPTSTPPVINPFNPSWATTHSNLFAAATLALATKSERLSCAVTVQLLDIVDISTSAWESLQTLEAEQRGEARRGREIIRVPVGGADDDDLNQDLNPNQNQDPNPNQNTNTNNNANNNSKKTHRFILQDAHATLIHALELAPLSLSSHMGQKLLLRAGTVVARGVILLKPENVVLLGGRVDAWQRAWAESRGRRLRTALGVQAPTSNAVET